MTEERMRVSADIEGGLARAFLKEFGKMAGRGEVKARTDLVRAALVEYLNRRGYEVKDELPDWGGRRSPSDDDEQGQQAAGAGLQRQGCGHGATVSFRGA